MNKLFSRLLSTFSINLRYRHIIKQHLKNQRNLFFIFFFFWKCNGVPFEIPTEITVPLILLGFLSGIHHYLIITSTCIFSFHYRNFFIPSKVLTKIYQIFNLDSKKQLRFWVNELNSLKVHNQSSQKKQ